MPGQTSDHMLAHVYPAWNQSSHERFNCKQNPNTVRRELCRGVVTSICKEDGGEEDVVYIQSRRAPVLTVTAVL